ncbi:MAG TPA: 4-amino-4-deoxychorismate lyase, partial [Mycoplana sp.]|nr:4-amino-4-deoxychorismate lyase [Mycoplana sp.]
MSDNNDSTEMSFGRGDTAGKGPIIPKSANEALRPEPVPSPPRRSRKARSQVVVFLNFLMTSIVLVTLAAAAIFYYALDSFEKPGPLAANTNFIVRNGAGLNEIAASLERNNIITDS